MTKDGGRQPTKGPLKKSLDPTTIVKDPEKPSKSQPVAEKNPNTDKVPDPK